MSSLGQLHSTSRLCNGQSSHRDWRVLGFDCDLLLLVVLVLRLTHTVGHGLMPGLLGASQTASAVWTVAPVVIGLIVIEN